MNAHMLRRMVRGAVVALLPIAGATVCAQVSNSGPALPPAARKAFERSYPGATISTTTQTRDNNQTVFRVDSLDKSRRRILLYDATGKVIEVAEQVQEAELPKPVADAMHSHPRAIYVSGLKVTRGSNVEYRLTLRGTRKTAMVAKPDGTVLSFK